VLAILASGRPAPGQMPAYATLYDPLNVYDLNFEMDSADWNAIKNDSLYTLVRPAYFWADGENKIPVTVRRKPNLADGDKVALKVDINEFFDNLQWHGVKKLSLENGYDKNVVAEGLAWYLHRRAAGEAFGGYQPPLASWVNVTVNGELLGVYVNVEQPDKMFLRNHDLFVSGETYLYKQGDIGPPELHVGSGVSPASAALNYRPFVAAGSVPPAGYETQVDSLINMRQMLTVGAINAFTCNPDELMDKGKNFFFADFGDGVEDARRLYFPWDLDAVFQNPETSIYGKPDRRTGLYPDYQQYLVHNPVWHDDYNQILLDLLAGPLAVAPLLAFLDDLQAVLTPSLALDPFSNMGTTPEDIAGEFSSLRQWVTARHAFVLQEVLADMALHATLAAPEPSTLALLAVAVTLAWRRRRGR
jgi:spore coat protein CotH